MGDLLDCIEKSKSIANYTTTIPTPLATVEALAEFAIRENKKFRCSINKDGAIDVEIGK